jgi:hypothetical protein
VAQTLQKRQRNDENVTKISELVKSDHWFICRVIADEFGMRKKLTD